MHKCNVMFSFSVVIVFCLFYLVDSSNIDVVNYTKYNKTVRSMFGFSVSTHKEQGQSWVLVGAPKGQDHYSGIRQGGVVYKCNVHYDDDCEEIRFHDNISEKTRALDDKEEQWFGATISSAGIDGPVVACAPRYVWFTTSREERRDPVGTCYVAKNNFRSFSEYSPCRTSLFGYHRQGSCQAGFSAGISKDSRRLFIGAPGSWYWQGQTYSIDPSIKYPYTPGIFGEAFGFGTKGQVIQQNLDDRPTVVSTPESPPPYDNSYMGYSMVVGDFNGEGIQGVAVGMPKGGDEEKNKKDILKGKVLLYSWNLTNYLNITGLQFGEYFGYSLATSDIDGDHRDDLIIGAPLHAEKNTEMKYEVGRVYIAYQGKNGSFAKRTFLDGFNSKSRFGLAVSGLGDLNLDSFGDFAVGAPYDGPNEQGAVYIFQGSANGVITQYSQVIYAEDIQSLIGTFHYIETFGFSISGGLDLDGNDYPDMAIGAYLSDSSFFFRSRPVIKVEAKLNFVANPKQIFFEQKNCAKPGNPFILVPCIEIEFCMKYTGIGTPSTMEFGLTYNLDTRISSFSRMYFDGNSNKSVNETIILRKDSAFDCRTRKTVYLKEQLSDKLTELEIQVKYFLNEKKYFHSTRDPNSILLPVLDSTYPDSANDTVSIYKNCGEDNICIPNLYLEVKKKLNKYVYQVGKPFQFDVRVINSEENAYDTKFYINLPEDIRIHVAYKVGDDEVPISCKPVNDTLYGCAIADPLTKDNPVHFIIEVEPLGKHKILKPSYDFYMNVTSANPGRPEDLVNASRHITVDIWVKADLEIEVKSVPSTVFFNISHGSSKESMDNEMYPLVTHSYTLTNKGPSDVEEVEMYIVWPSETLSGQNLLYLMEQPHTLGGVTCERVDVNPLNLPVSHLKDVWSNLGIKVQSFFANSSHGFLVENGTARPGDVGDTITKTVTKVTFFNSNNKVVHTQTLYDEHEKSEYWGNISAVAIDFNEPLTIQTNESTLIERYIQRIKVNESIIARPDKDAVREYKILSNSTTEIRYYGPTHNLILAENVTLQPGSLEFKDLIKTTRDLHKDIMTVATTTSKNIRIETLDGKPVHEEILTQTGTDIYTNPEIYRTSVITYVTYYDQNHKQLFRDALSVKPTSDSYWEQIDKFISRYRKPVSVHISTVKLITYYKNGQQVRQEEFPFSNVAEAPVSTQTETTTLITITNTAGALLYQKDIPGDEYDSQVNSIVETLKEPVNVNVTTTYTIRYIRTDGKVTRIGKYVKQVLMEIVVPNQVETSSVSTITTITIFDNNRNVLRREDITEEPGSKQYWEKIHKLVSKYYQGSTVVKKEQQIITYYINGKEVRKVPDTSGYNPETSLSISTEVLTKIRVVNASGHTVYTEDIPKPMNEDYINTIINRFREFITVKVTTTYTILYRNANGKLIKTGVHIQGVEITPYPDNPQQKVTTTVTTVTILDVHNKVVYSENITDTPDSAAYWEKLNKIIESYKEPVTIRKTVTIINTFYVNGVPIRVTTESNPTSTVITTRIDSIRSTVTVHNSRGNILFQEPIPGEVSASRIKEIVDRFRESITINIKTTYDFSYVGPDNRVIRTETHVVERTESHTHNQNETSETTTITTVTLLNPSGNIVFHENITETPGTKQYWEKLTQLVSSFREQVTVDVKTQTIIIYYVNGYVVGTKVVDGSDVKETSLTTQSEITTSITITNLNGATLHTENLRRRITNEDIQDFVRRFQESIIVHVETTHRITYINSEGRIVKIDTFIEKRTDKHIRPTNETSSVSTKTTIVFYDNHRNILHQETITEQPDSQEYWKKITEIINRFRQTDTFRVTIEKVTTYYVNGQPIRVEPLPVDPHPITITSRTDVTTYIEIQSSDGRTLYETPVNFEKGTTGYRSVVTDLVRRFREPVIVTTKTNFVVTYMGVNGKELHKETITKIETETHNYQQPETESVSSVTSIKYFDAYNRLIHQDSIREEPGSRIFWDHIKASIERVRIPASIQTNTTKVITYYVNGFIVRQEQRNENNGAYASPIICETETLISYYDSQTKFLHTEHAPGDLNSQEIQIRIAAFGKNYQIGTVQVHKTVTIRSSTGQIVHTFTIPVNHQQSSRVVTTTTFTVYGTDKNRLLYNETITGEPGSESYNSVVAKIMQRFPPPFTIFANSTKVTTFFSQDGRMINQRADDKVQSTIRKESNSIPASARTTITFYGPDGEQMHSNTINGAPGTDLQDQLRKIASEYNGVVRSYSGGSAFVNGGSIGGNVNSIDISNQRNTNLYNDFTAHNIDPNQNNSQYYSEYEDAYNSEDIQDLSNEGLASYAKPSGFRTGGLDFGATNGGSVDRYVDHQARTQFDNQRSYHQDHNYLSSHSNSRSKRDASLTRTKREDNTENDIKTLSNCKTSKCLLIKCKSGPIKNGYEVDIAIRARVFIQTLRNVSMTQPVTLQSSLLARVSKFRELAVPPADRKLYSGSAATKVMAPQPDIKPDVVPLWVVVVSAVAGTLILLLLIFLLYMCGFFNRSRPSDAPERQPLNRNGHFHHGDEAL